MAQITSGSLTIVDVTDGAPGLNNTTVFLYRRAVSAPDKPTGNLTYTFATASITGALEGWVQSINELTGSDPIWMIAAVASSNGETDVIESSEWAGPIKMAQNGQDGLPGAPGINGLNQATIFIYKRDDSATAPSSTTYTFATGGFTVPSGWSKTIPTEPKGKPCWVTSAIAIGAEATAELNWVAPSVLVEDGSDGISPTVTATENGVKIVDADGNETFITNGADGTSYYTFVRYSKNANGSGYVATPTSETIYIGVYTGTKSSPPAYNDSGWTWSKYVGADGQPGTQGPTGPTGPQGVSVAATRELYYLKMNSIDPAQITNANQIYTTDDVNQWTSIVPTYIGSGKYYTCIETTLSNGNVVWSAPIENKGLTDANVNAANAIEIARGVKQHFFWVATDKSENIPAGAYVAEQSEESFYSNPTKGNILTRSDGIWIRNGVDKLATLQGGGLTFLVPTGTYKGQKSVSLNGSGLTFYNIGSSNSAAATLASDGLQITNGSIVLGTTSGTAAGNVTLSNKNFTRSINETSHNDLRFAIGSKFGVASDGTLYSAGLDSVSSSVQTLDGRVTTNENNISTNTEAIKLEASRRESAVNILLDTDVSSLTAVNAPSARYWGSTSFTSVTSSFVELSDAPEPSIHYAVRMVNDGTNSSHAYRSISFYGAQNTTALPLKDGTKYTVSWWARLVSGSGGTNGDYRYKTGANRNVLPSTFSQSTDNLTSTWKLFTNVIELESMPTDHTRIHFYGIFPANTAGTVELCGFKMTAGDSIVAYSTKIEQTANNVLIQATRTDTTAAQGGQHLIQSLINVAPSGVTIDADKVNINGTTVFNDGTSIQSRINAIEVGGRNLLKDSMNLIGGWSYNQATVSDGIATISPTATGDMRIYQMPANSYFTPEVNTVYTISVEAKSSNGAKLGLMVNWANISSKTFTVTSNWARYSWTFTSGASVGTGSTTICVADQVTGVTLMVRNPKLEKGNKATDWSPAPEDVQDEIDAKKNVHTLLSGNADGTSYSTILGYAKEGTSTTFVIDTTSTPITKVKVGDSVRIGYYVSNMGSSGNRPLVYINGIVTANVDSTHIRITAHGLDTTIIDGGNIITNSIGANQIKANAITAEKLDATTINASNKLTIGAMTTDDQSSILNSNIEVGGRNLVKNTADYLNWYVYGTNHITYSGNEVRMSVSGATALLYTRVEGGLTIKTVDINNVDRYLTLSIEVYSPDWSAVSEPTTSNTGLGAISITLVTSDTSDHGAQKAYYFKRFNTAGFWEVAPTATNSKWLKFVSKPFKLTNSSWSGASSGLGEYLRIGPSLRANGTVYFRNLKLEYGNKATDWTPAPEDGDTRHITEIDDNGIKVHAANNVNSNYAKIDADGLEVFKGGVSVAKYGDSARIGKEASGHTITKSDGLHVWTGVESTASNEVAFFGATARLGTASGARVITTSSGMQVYNASNEKRAEFGGDWALLGNPDSTRITVNTGTSPQLYMNYNGNSVFSVTSSGVYVGDYTNSTAANKNFVFIKSDGMHVYQANTEVAIFGATARVGKQNDYHTEIDSDGFRLVDNEGSSFMDVSYSGAKRTNKRRLVGTSAYNPSSSSSSQSTPRLSRATVTGGTTVTYTVKDRELGADNESRQTGTFTMSSSGSDTISKSGTRFSFTVKPVSWSNGKATIIVRTTLNVLPGHVMHISLESAEEYYIPALSFNGATNFDGDLIVQGEKLSIDAGDKINNTCWYGAGFLTSSGTQAYFTLPISKVITASSVTVTQLTMITRQAGRYTHGSSSSNLVEWEPIEATIVPGGVRIAAERSTTTDAVNNDVIGINAHVWLSFSD